MSTEAPTNPVDGEDTAAATLPGEAEVETQVEETVSEPQYDDDGNLIEGPAEEEEEEFELDDLKLRVPKTAAEKLRELKEGNLRQADYTRKTQEAAELRKAVEAERQQLRETSEAELSAAAQITAIDQQIQTFSRVDWNAWNDADPFEAQKAFMHFQQLKDSRQNALGQLQHLRNERISKAQQETAKRIEEGRTALSKDIPGGWNDDLKAKLIDYAAGYGFSREDLDDLEADPRVARVLHAAFTGSEAVRKAAQAQSHLKAQTVQPAAAVRANKAPPAGLSDDLPTDNWMERRNKQVRSRA